MLTVDLLCRPRTRECTYDDTMREGSQFNDTRCSCVAVDEVCEIIVGGWLDAVNP